MTPTDDAQSAGSHSPCSRVRPRSERLQPADAGPDGDGERRSGPRPTCWSRRRPARARRSPSASPSRRRCSASAERFERGRPAARAWSSRRRANSPSRCSANSTGSMRRRGFSTATCVGGMDMRKERRALERGAHLVVGTPGRLRDHITKGALDLGALRAVVLDEADEMLDLGFRDDLEFILGAAPEERRTLMFSATVPRGIAELAKTFQRDARAYRGHGIDRAARRHRVPADAGAARRARACHHQHAAQLRQHERAGLLPHARGGAPSHGAARQSRLLGGLAFGRDGAVGALQRAAVDARRAGAMSASRPTSRRAASTCPISTS